MNHRRAGGRESPDVFGSQIHNQGIDIPRSPTEGLKLRVIPMKHLKITKRIHRRRGSMLTEGIIACLILGVAIGMLVPGLSAIGRQRQAMRFDTLAMIELNNIADIFAKTDTKAADVKVSDWFSGRYADAVLNVEPLPVDETFTKDLLNGLRLSIHRPQAEGMPDQKVSVVVWRTTGAPTP